MNALRSACKAQPDSEGWRLHRPLYTAELARLVRRHAGAGAAQHRDAISRVAGALDWLGRHEHAHGPRQPGWPAVCEVAAITNGR
jgi:hypothetical protein